MQASLPAGRALRTVRNASCGIVLTMLLLAGTNGVAFAQTDQQARDAIVRLGQMEDQMRQLQGQVEELQHENAQLKQQLSERAANTAATQTNDDGPAQATPDAGKKAPADDTSAASDAGSSSETGTPSRSTAPGTLGTLPKGSFAEPSPEEQQATAARAAAINPTAPAKQQYEAALQLMQQGQWDSARAVFQNITTRYPKDPLAPNAAYWEGETYYVSKDYQNAAATFAKNYRTYGADGTKAPDTLLKLGMSLAATGDKDKACQIYVQLDKRYPDATAAIKQTAARARTSAGCS